MGRLARGEGSTLVEVMVAMLLIAAAASAMAGILLHGPLQVERLDLKEQASLQGGAVLDLLRNYVSDDHSAVTQALGLAPDNCWNLRNPPRTGFCPAGWALDVGTHPATFLLPPELSAPPISMTLTYDVVTSADGRPFITTHLNWNTP